MGRPLAHVPDQAGDCHASYARHHAQTFIDTFAGLGIQPDRYYWMSELYAAGTVDPYIRIALDRAEAVRAIYLRVAKVQHPADWHPIQVDLRELRPDRHHDRDATGTASGSTTNAGRTSSPGPRAAATAGWVEPFGGRAKLGWNLEWAAQWSIFGVTIEPCGKDLATAGGSRDRADAIAREIFEREPPLNVPYEFLNIGGRKMSTSKGLGVAAHEIVRGRPARAAPPALPASAAADRDRVRPGRHGRDPAPVRRVRPAGRRDGRAARPGRAAGRPRERLPLLAARSGRRRGGRRRGVPAGLRPPGAPPPDPGGRHRRPDRGREGRPADRRPRRPPCASGSPPPMPGSRRLRPDKVADRGPPRRPARRGRRAGARTSGRGSAAWPRRSPAARRSGVRRCLAGPDLLDRDRAPGCPPAGLRARSTWPSSGRPNGPRAGWLLASLEPAFVQERLRAAAAGAGRAGAA